MRVAIVEAIIGQPGSLEYRSFELKRVVVVGQSLG